MELIVLGFVGFLAYRFASGFFNIGGARRLKSTRYLTEQEIKDFALFHVAETLLYRVFQYNHDAVGCFLGRNRKEILQPLQDLGFLQRFLSSISSYCIAHLDKNRNRSDIENAFVECSFLFQQEYSVARSFAGAQSFVRAELSQDGKVPTDKEVDDATQEFFALLKAADSSEKQAMFIEVTRFSVCRLFEMRFGESIESFSEKITNRIIGQKPTQNMAV